MKQRTRRNVLFLFPDQHRGDWMPYEAEIAGRMGMEPLPIRMPNVRRLMKRGVTFTRAVTPSPLCAPARACLAAGVRYEACAVADNGADYPPEKRTVYAELRDAGYSVGGVGKFDLNKKTEWWGLDGWLPLHEQLGFTHGIDNAGKLDAVRSGAEAPKDPYMKYLYDNDLAETHLRDMRNRIGDKRLNTEPTPLPDEAYCDNWLTRNGVRLLREFPKGKPWFLAVNFAGPHHPWDVTESMRRRWEDVEFPAPVSSSPHLRDAYNRIRQNYAAMLENIDDNIGRLLAEVEARGEADNTIVVYASDHGEMLGDFDAFNKSRPERGSVHIPLVVAGPDIRQGVVSDALVELQDLAATLIDYAGAGMSESFANGGLDSVSLRPVLEGRRESHRHCQYSALGDWRMAVVGNYKLIVNQGAEDRLYDVSGDPWELNNLASAHLELVEELKRMLPEKEEGNR